MKEKSEVGSDGTPITAATSLGTDGNEKLALRPVGMFYLATGGDAATIEPADPTGDPPTTPAGDTVAADAKATQVYTFVNNVGTTNAANPVTSYVVLSETIATTDDAGETTTTYAYEIVDIHHPVNQDGVGETGAAGDEMVFVTADLPSAMDYDHVHFGVWAGLGEAAKDGSQDIASLGIGFVQSIGDGMSGADMPNNGSAMYMGNWAGTVQQAHPDGEGKVSLEQDEATVDADFSKGEIEVMLTNLATLKGDIAGNMFSGDEASGLSGEHGLDTEADFTGSFSGGFYGEKAAETAGVFSFSTEDNEGGAFTGAFGGAKDE